VTNEDVPFADGETETRTQPSTPAAEDAAGEASHEPERGSRIGSVASSIADAAGPVVSAALTPVRALASGANRIMDKRDGARVRRVRRMGHSELVNLWDVHPEARRASIRELGLLSVPVGEIKGTAVEGAPQRGGDFLPLKDRRSADWRGRWQRILNAIDRLEALPPIELIRFGDEFWVVDGHNRVAAALYNGQVELDAVVEELRLPGVSSTANTPANLAPVLEGSLDLRAAGSGRLTRTALRPSDMEGVRRARQLEAERGLAEERDAADSTDRANPRDGSG